MFKVIHDLLYVTALSGKQTLTKNAGRSLSDLRSTF